MNTPLPTFEDPDFARVKIIPIEFIKVLAEDEKNNGRAAALILTKEDILSIKRYERRSLNLPNTLLRVEQDIGFTRSGIPGLEPNDLLLTYRAINEHGRSWSAIESDIKSNGFNLDLFAGAFSSQGRQILDYIDKMEVVQLLELTVADLTVETINHVKPGPLTETDLKVCQVLADFLKKIAAQIEEHRVSSAKLAEDIGQFTQTLTVELIPAISDKVRLASRSDLDEEILALEQNIDQLTAEIDRKHDEYYTTANNIAWGIFGGPIGVGITGGIFGSKAEKIRKEKNRLIKEKEANVQSLQQKRPLAAAVRSLELLFEDMKIRMLDAHQSATNLQDLWALLVNYIASSADGLAQIRDDQALLTFALQFRSIVTPWTDIKGITAQLLTLFESAVNQFLNEQSK